jgi:hypothetical protein
MSRKLVKSAISVAIGIHVSTLAMKIVLAQGLKADVLVWNMPEFWQSLIWGIMSYCIVWTVLSIFKI